MKVKDFSYNLIAFLVAGSFLGPAYGLSKKEEKEAIRPFSMNKEVEATALTNNLAKFTWEAEGWVYAATYNKVPNWDTYCKVADGCNKPNRASSNQVAGLKFKYYYPLPENKSIIKSIESVVDLEVPGFDSGIMVPNDVGKEASVTVKFSPEILVKIGRYHPIKVSDIFGLAPISRGSSSLEYQAVDNNSAKYSERLNNQDITKGNLPTDYNINMFPALQENSTASFGITLPLGNFSIGYQQGAEDNNIVMIAFDVANKTPSIKVGAVYARSTSAINGYNCLNYTGDATGCVHPSSFNGYFGIDLQKITFSIDGYYSGKETQGEKETGAIVSLIRHFSDFEIFAGAGYSKKQGGIGTNNDKAATATTPIFVGISKDIGAGVLVTASANYSNFDNKYGYKGYTDKNGVYVENEDPGSNTSLMLVMKKGF